MSGAHVRHARSKWEWGTPPSRSAERSQAVAEDVREPAKKAPARKDTRSWCKGKVGTGHVPAIVVDHAYPFRFDRRTTGCHWRVGWSSDKAADIVFWGCLHHELCANCGKVLRDRWSLPSAECPAYPGSPEQRAEAEAELIETEKRRAEWEGKRRTRKRPITGPQGYRRKRAPSPAQ